MQRVPGTHLRRDGMRLLQQCVPLQQPASIVIFLKILAPHPRGSASMFCSTNAPQSFAWALVQHATIFTPFASKFGGIGSVYGHGTRLLQQCVPLQQPASIVIFVQILGVAVCSGSNDEPQPFARALVRHANICSTCMAHAELPH